jgi:peroxiredoxin
MSLVNSTMMPLGTTAPDFTLPDTLSEKTISLKELKSDTATVVFFTCNHCPFVKHIHAKLLDIITEYQDKGIAFVAISANDPGTVAEDAPDKMRQLALDNDYTFPYCFDESQQIAKAYFATCTPDFYLFDEKLQCVYRGRFDDSTPGNDTEVTGKDLCEAMNSVLAHQPISQEQLPSMGCSIKWR